MKSTRKAYGEFLEEIGKDKNVTVVDADLSKSTCTNMFKELYPKRHFNVGISEQDLIGTSCGLSIGGKKVFASSFAMFLAGRGYEQIRNTAAYSNLDVNFCATHSGVAIGEDGATHQAIEDINLMNGIPNITVLSPSDEYSTKNILRECYNVKGPKYIRLGRTSAEEIYNKDSKFKIGGSNVFGEGTDATIFATGNTLQIALKAMEELKDNDIKVRVVDLYSIKPIDRKTILDCSKETDKLVSIEDHSVIGGIGSIISNILCEENPKKLIKIGVKDVFGESGGYKELYNKHGLTSKNIIKNIQDKLEE